MVLMQLTTITLREREKERDQEKGCEYRGHRECDLLGIFGDLEVSPFGKERWLWNRNWGASSGGILGIERPREHRLLCRPSRTSMILH